ncbi:MAG: glycosyltransferase [Chloroflexota bacterium]
MQPTKRILGQQDIIHQIIARQRSEEKGHLLDIGSGAGHAAHSFLKAGWQVSATGYDLEAYGEDGKSALTEATDINLYRDVDITEMSVFEDASFDSIWCAHVIEHVLDTGLALKEVRRILKPGGAFYVSVPPFKHAVVGGHVHAGWNLGLLMYVLALAGFGLEDGSFVKHGYNLFAAVTRGKGPLSRDRLRFAAGDLEALQAEGRFPSGFNARQGLDGDFWAWNWRWTQPPVEVEPHPKTLQKTPPYKMALIVPWLTKGRGGTENVGHMMANAMAERGHEVHVFTFDDNKAPSKWPLHESILLHYLPADEAEKGDGQMLLAMADLSPDVIIGLHMNRTLLRYAKCATKLKIPLVLSEHIDPRLPERDGKFTKQERLMAFHAATRIHLLLGDYKEELPPYIKSKTKTIPNTVPPAQKLASPANANGKKILLTVARFVSRKNTDYLIRAFAIAAEQVSDWHLHIMGYGPQEQALKKLAVGLPCNDRIKFLGVGYPYDVLPNAHLFAIPSVIEGFPLTNLEAMAHGLPTIGFRCCKSVSAQIIDGKTGFLVSGTPGNTDFIDKLLQLMTNEKLREAMGKAALERYKKHYSNEVINNTWEKMFSEAVTDFEPIMRSTPRQMIDSELNKYVFGGSLK